MESSEQIIKDDLASMKKKDPKKVAAGRALARKNAEARNISKKELPSESLSFSDVNNRIQTAAGFVGAGFVLYHGYKFFTNINTTPASVEEKEEEPPKAKKGPNLIDMDF